MTKNNRHWNYAVHESETFKTVYLTYNSFWSADFFAHLINYYQCYWSVKLDR